jgi:hypothetical protein
MLHWFDLWKNLSVEINQAYRFDEPFLVYSFH